jgi:hypothetical protein
MNWWLFPPATHEAQFDEKRAFVGKKQKHCDPEDPADARRGDHWDHVGFDPEHRLVVSVVPGKRTAQNTEALVRDFKTRTHGRPMNLITTDEYAPYREALLKAYGQCIQFPPTGRRGRPKGPRWVAPPNLHYATVHKTREKGRVVKVEPRVIFGCPKTIEAALKASTVNRLIAAGFSRRRRPPGRGTRNHR